MLLLTVLNPYRLQVVFINPCLCQTNHRAKLLQHHIWRHRSGSAVKIYNNSMCESGRTCRIRCGSWSEFAENPGLTPLLTPTLSPLVTNLSSGTTLRKDMEPASACSPGSQQKKAACNPCRRSKVACGHEQPVCHRCIQRGQSVACVYREAPFKKRKIQDLSQGDEDQLGEPHV